MEDMLVDELKSFGIQSVKSTIAGVAFQGDLETAYRVCLWSRIANRVLLVLDSFQIKNQEDLYRGIQRIDWFEHLAADGSFAVSFNAKNSQVITNTHFGALKVKDAVVDQMRTRFNVRPSIDTERPDIRINVHVQNELTQVSIDLSGESLHRRGYREVTIKAPMKENLAAAMLIRSGWPKIAKTGGSLLDPMCGSGTLLLEGAMMAADFAPGLLRDYFGFIGWKKHDALCWQTLRVEAEQRRNIGFNNLPVIVGYDQNSQTVKVALSHISKAGLQQKIHVERRDINDARPANSWPPGLLVCNPPYGERLGDDQQAAELYKNFGEIIKTNFIGWQAAMIISNPELGFRLGIRSQKPITLFNGALECKLLRMDITQSAFFVPKAKSQQERLENVTEISRQQENDEIVGAEMFANRLKKNLKKLNQWVKQSKVNCYRLYDADLPEYAVAIDVYKGEHIWLNVQEYAPPKTIDQHKADQRLAALLAELPKIMSVNHEHIFLKVRRKQRSTDQYEKQSETGHFHVVEEAGCKLLVNFEDYLDTGLFLDHRPIRLMIQQQARDKRFLNLFAYTGSATVHAAVGGARLTTTVDLSNTYINWAKNNLALNNTSGEHEFIQADCPVWLASEANKNEPRRYDLIFLDPPTFSNSKRMEGVFDVQIDHVALINHAAKLLSEDGVLYFSTNFRRFKLEIQSLSMLNIENITAISIPEDFARDPKIHYCWRIKKNNA